MHRCQKSELTAPPRRAVLVQNSVADAAYPKPTSGRQYEHLRNREVFLFAERVALSSGDHTLCGARSRIRRASIECSNTTHETQNGFRSITELNHSTFRSS
jgi:hypothetical protein